MATTATVPTFTLGDRLRKAREHAGVSVDEMAAILDVSDRTVRNYETDKTPIKRPSVVAYAMRCNVPVEWLVVGRDQRGNDQRCNPYPPEDHDPWDMPEAA